MYKKQYTYKLKNKLYSLSRIKKNYKILDTNTLNSFSIVYIVEILFSKTNTLLHITNAEGKLKFFCSAGNLLFKGKNKKARSQILRNLINILIKKLQFLKNRPLILRLKNVGFKKMLIIRKLKKKTFIKIFTGLNLYSYNGCRKKKIRRI